MPRARPLLGLSLLALFACEARRAPSPSDAPAQAPASFAAFERGLIGPPPEEGELLRARVRGIELRRPPGWPECCQPLAEAARQEANAQEPRLALGDHRHLADIHAVQEDAWTEVHARFELPAVELHAGVEEPPPLAIPPEHRARRRPRRRPLPRTLQYDCLSPCDGPLRDRH